jgi:hypothetical protein
MAVLWYGDGIQNTLEKQWGGVSDDAHCAIATTGVIPDTQIFMVNDVRFTKGKAIEFIMAGGGTPCYEGRVELDQGGGFYKTENKNPDRRFYSGNTYWFGFQATISTNETYKGNAGFGGIILQVHREQNGKSPFAFKVWQEGGTNVLQVGGYNSKIGPPSDKEAYFDITVLKPAKTETVYNFLCEYKASKEQFGGGWKAWVVEAGKPFPEKPSEELNGTQTILAGEEGGLVEPNHLDIGYYPHEKRAAEVRIGGFTCATTRADVETNAFGATELPPKVTKPADQVGCEGIKTELKIQAENATAYKATNLPAGLSINESTGVIVGIPETVKEKSDTVTITVEGKAKPNAETTFNWSIPFGKTTLGAETEVIGTEKARANKYTNVPEGSITKLTVYLTPKTGVVGTQKIKGFIYADEGTPGPVAPPVITEE